MCYCCRRKRRAKKSNGKQHDSPLTTNAVRHIVTVCPVSQQPQPPSCRCPHHPVIFRTSPAMPFTENVGGHSFFDLNLPWNSRPTRHPLRKRGVSTPAAVALLETEARTEYTGASIPKMYMGRVNYLRVGSKNYDSNFF